MDISEITSSEFESVDANARASELDGRFRETGAKAIVVVDDGEYVGLVTPRQLTASHVDPDTKARSLVWSVARVDATEDVRRVAGLLVGSATKVLPVFEGGSLVGVVTTEALLDAVTPFLGVLDVSDVYTEDLLTVTPETTLGTVVHHFREHRVTHLPVVPDEGPDAGEPVGIVSIFDVVDFTTRAEERPTGGAPGAFAAPGGGASAGGESGGRTHGGFGERAGGIDRMLDLPVRDVMSTPVETGRPDESLDRAVSRMLDAGVSSLVVTENEQAVGIVTTTDVLRALTWTDDRRLPVQITNVDLLDDITREAVADLIEGVASKFADLSVLEANVFLHEHEERLRGTPLIMARIRLFTDKGHFVGTGEGYGASHAIRLAANVLERQLLEGKEYAQTMKKASEDDLSKMLGWWLTGTSRKR